MTEEEVVRLLEENRWDGWDPDEHRWHAWIHVLLARKGEGKGLVLNEKPMLRGGQ